MLAKRGKVVSDEYERRLKELRRRVKSQLGGESAADAKSSGLLAKAAQRTPLRTARPARRSERLHGRVGRVEQGLQRYVESHSEDSHLRNMAAWCILAGAILGIAGGLLQLTGNPAELVENSEIFVFDQSVDVSGLILDVNGSEMSGVEVSLVEVDTNDHRDLEVSGESGMFRFKDVPQRPMRLEFSKPGFETIHLLFLPDEANLHHVTMHSGEGTKEMGSIAESSLRRALALGTAIGVLTILMAAVGIHASFEVKRGLHFRRTMYLAGISMFSRGLIIVGPALTLIGMGFMYLARQQFEDVIDEDSIEIHLEVDG